MKEITPGIPNPGSFRDPAGVVFSKDTSIYRSIFAPGVEDFEAARDGGIYKKLSEAGLLLAHEEVDVGGFAPDGTVYCLHYKPLPMISYPWEWPFSMLKDAARIHLDAMEILVPEGFWLRDASAFNTQYDGHRLRLIDTLSIGRRVPDSPWVAYGQFCSHFLAPLALAAYCDIRTLCFWRTYVNGYPISLVKKMLPAFRRYQPRLFMHLTLHARLQETTNGRGKGARPKPRKSPTLTDSGLIGLVRSLRRTSEGIKWRGDSKLWGHYESIRPYPKEDVARKSRYVDRVVERIQPRMTWDLGGNTGEFSMIAASRGGFVVSIDSDPACTERLYQRLSRESGCGRILPLTMDLANPSPGLGWDSRERPGLRDRGPADLVMALALIHHLVFANSVPLGLIADWFAGLAKHLLVEFVPLTDPMVQTLLMNRRNESLPYTLDLFMSSFGEHFDFLDRVVLDNDRRLFLCRRK